jgi:hypothetical protein
VFATFSKNIKDLTFAGCRSEIPFNSFQFPTNRKYCYQSATKFSTMSWVGVKVYFTRSGYFTLMVSNCEELVGVFSGNDGAGFRGISTWSIK